MKRLSQRELLNMYNDLLGMQRETHPWIKSNELSSSGFSCVC